MLNHTVPILSAGLHVEDTSLEFLGNIALQLKNAICKPRTRTFRKTLIKSIGVRYVRQVRTKKGHIGLIAIVRLPLPASSSASEARVSC